MLKYCQCFCEENIYQLASSLNKEDTNNSFVLFISSSHKSVPIWCQKKGNPVVWDYHVTLLTLSSIGSHIIRDFDCEIGYSLPVRDYLEKSFPSIDLPSEYRQLIRLIHVPVFLNYFASDRSHMLESSVPFPTWSPICGSLATSSMNLMSFVEMTNTPPCDGNKLIHYLISTKSDDATQNLWKDAWLGIVVPVDTLKECLIDRSFELS